MIYEIQRKYLKFDRGTKMIVGASNFKGIGVRVYVTYARGRSQSKNKYICNFIETDF